ncbi:fused MFS/spermidine synthase [candidate division WOR-3 bacterium]|nr:fused MFS/spermidine synthase [candidate division WOR-3 bacterium]
MRIRVTVFITGLTSVIAQTVIMREGLVLFGGFELVSGVLLCFWLIWAGIGSLLAGRWFARTDPLKTASVLLFIQCICVLYAVIFLRCSLRIFSYPYGEIISLGGILLVSCLALAPPCMVFGALFPVLSRALEPNSVYLIESVGAFIGGIAATFLLIHFIPPVGVIVLVVACLLSCGFVLRGRYLLVLASFCILFSLAKVKDIELILRQIQMPHQNIVALEESRYGMIAVTRNREQVNFYVNGVYDFSYPDPYTTEEAVHYSLLLHEEPTDILLIGGGVGSCLSQILKHPSIKRVTYVELDPLLFTLGSEHIPTGNDYGAKVQIVFGDARFYIKNTQATYDVVIVNLPDPVNAQLNRFYTREFFAESRNVLKKGGIFTLRISAPTDIISTLHGELLQTVKQSLSSAYNNVLVLPVSRMTFLASDHVIDAQTVRAHLKKNMEARNLDLQYVNSYFFDYELTPEKVGYVQQRIDESQGTVNIDLKPVCYYYTMILWGGAVSESVRTIAVRLFHASPWLFLIPLILVLPFYRRKSIVYISVMAVGASEISAEVVLIILFQVFYGYLYGWIGTIIASYMIGLALGTFLCVRTPLLRDKPVILLSHIEFIMALYFSVMLGITMVPIPAINVLILILIFCGGVIGGLHFPLSVALVSQRRAGIIYGIDLIGSAFGAMITSVLLIPIIGIRFTLLLFIMLNVLVGMGLRTIPGKK